MNSNDEIVEEVRAAREAYAVRFNYDLVQMYKDLKAKEQARVWARASIPPLEPCHSEAGMPVK